MTTPNTTATLPPTPFQCPVVGKNGLMSVPWANWFKQIFLLTGGSNIPSIAAIEAELITLSLDVATIDTTLVTIQNEVNWLWAGRHL